MLALLLLIIPFSQEQFDNYIENDRIVIVKYVEEDIPALDRAVVKMLIRQNNVVIMQDKPAGDLFMGVYSKKTKVLFYGEYKWSLRIKVRHLVVLGKK